MLTTGEIVGRAQRVVAEQLMLIGRQLDAGKQSSPAYYEATFAWNVGNWPALQRALRELVGRIRRSPGKDRARARLIVRAAIVALRAVRIVRRETGA